ncbi:MAG: pyrroline-5-carboxylate reductase [Candidatus Gracilibacteria bacterium]|nr:pyrroline-5-carboxylate reductase [Candidatus Gracilibacteria bacterium]
MLGFLGCGNMGGAILDAIVQQKLLSPTDILVVNREAKKNEKLTEKYGVRTTLDPTEFGSCACIVLGIKPQGLPELEFTPAQDTIVISILAGTPVSALAKKFPTARIVRAMPNLGQFAGAGMTGIFFDPGAGFSAAERTFVESLFRAGGEVLSLQQEGMIDAVTAISGSGPAYFFQLAESLTVAAEKQGFSPEESELLARQTLLGAGKVADQFTDLSLAQWKQKVMSPGGTTEKAIESFQKNDIEKIVSDAVQAAFDRAQELGQS